MKRFLIVSAIMIILLSFLFAVPFRDPFATKNNEIVCETGERVNTSQIGLEANRLVINIGNISISRYANTSSMIPIITENAKGITVVPRSHEEIKIGDIITYEKDNILIVHRVIETGYDDDGWYCIVKGDNIEQSDGKIRFEQIKSILIGILY